MQADIGQLRPYLQSFDFRSLLVEGLGWNHYEAESIQIPLEGHEYTLEPVAEKASFVVYVCGADADGLVPSYPIRRRIERQVAKLTFEHMIIFVDAEHTLQVWQWVRRESGKPEACREQQYRSGQQGDPLLQRLQTIAFSLEEEESLGVTIVASRVRQAMDVEKVTKQFYEQFRRELDAFQGFIDGITEQGGREWYASLMLNRMMFIYFVQKQGFLDGNTDYLRNRLCMVQQETGAGRFQQFYRIFLLRLFHEGLGKPESERAPDLAKLLGKVPFLNGGLFDVHDLERDNPDISIPDEAFERVFAFFEGYRWHLDERPRREDKEINPDVLGYIFEKYINQKQMGAYYTKEDITGYITRNTVIPFLFDAAKKECPVAFSPGGGVWRLLQDDPDRYIYPAVAHGVAWRYSPDVDPERLERPIELPEKITAGINDVSKRGEWNSPAADEYALPTETWREVVARRQRYAEVREQLTSGKIQDVNDLITLNLDIERFAKDVIIQSEGPELLRAFWHGIRDVSVLDPTCGSGAFLFAALNILEPLYTACLEGMQGFLDDLKRSNRPHHPKALSDFRRVLKQVEKHPSTRYFILKSIVLKNLYGVDIMEEAVEICKLRLFLKLVAQLETYDQIEPLPDIDFNIRAGNTLVGFTSLKEIQQTLSSDLIKQLSLPDIEERAEEAAQAFHMFQFMQTDEGMDAGDFATAKVTLRERLDKLRGELDSYLATEYGVKPDHKAAYQQWRASHRPFHWFVEFYNVMNKGGFDAVIGNPPYVEYGNIRKEYQVKGFSTEQCGNLYAMTWERSIQLSSDGHLGLIVPASAVCTDGYRPLRNLLTSSGNLVVSSYSDNPGKLFEGIPHNRLQIILLDKGHKREVYSTVYNKWRPEGRDFLFQNLAFIDSAELKLDAGIAKIGHKTEISILHKFNSAPIVPNQLKPRSKQFRIYFTRKLSHFVQILNFIPKIYDQRGQLRNPSELKEIRVNSELTRDGLLGLLNSSLFYWILNSTHKCNRLGSWHRNGQLVYFPWPFQTQLPTEALMGTYYQLTEHQRYQIYALKKAGHNQQVETVSYLLH